MKVAQVIELLKQNKPEDEIAIQWYVKEDMQYGNQVIEDKVWQEAIRLFDKWENSDMGYLLNDALVQARKNLEVKQ